MGRAVDGNNRFTMTATPWTRLHPPTAAATNSQDAWRVAADYQAGRFSHGLSYTGSDTDHKFLAEGAMGFSGRGTLERSGYLGSFSGSDALRLVYGVDLETSLSTTAAPTPAATRPATTSNTRRFRRSPVLHRGHPLRRQRRLRHAYLLPGKQCLPVRAGRRRTQAQGAYGTGFRAPSLYEGRLQQGRLCLPPAADTTLKEERSKGYDLGLSGWPPRACTWKAVYFDQKMEDEIYFDLPITPDTCSAVATRLQRRGLSADWPRAGEPLTDGQLHLQWHRDQPPGPVVPTGRNGWPISAYTGARWGTPWCWVRPGACPRMPQDIDGTQLDDYQLLELTASYQLCPACSSSAGRKRPG